MFDESVAKIVQRREAYAAARAERVDQLQRLHAYLERVAWPLTTRRDPVSGEPLATVDAEGDANRGPFSVTLRLFEGSRIDFAVDAYGRFSASASPNVFARLAPFEEIRDVHISDDGAQAFVDAEQASTYRGTGRVSSDLAPLLAALVDEVAARLEQQPDPPRAEPVR